MFTAIKSYGYQIALVLALAAIGYLGILLVSAEMEVSHQETLVAQSAKNLSDYKTEQATLTSQANQKYRDLEWSLVKLGHDKDKEKANALEVSAAAHATALASVQRRPARPTPGPASAVPAAAGSAPAEQGCGRERLYREDAEVVIGLAVTAADLRIELLDLRARYEAAQLATDQATPVTSAQ